MLLFLGNRKGIWNNKILFLEKINSNNTIQKFFHDYFLNFEKKRKNICIKKKYINYKKFNIYYNMFISNKEIFEQ